MQDRQGRRGLQGDAAVDADTLIAFCAGRLAGFKLPAALEFRDELPRTPVGKIQKHLLRADAARTYGRTR